EDWTVSPQLKAVLSEQQPSVVPLKPNGRDPPPANNNASAAARKPSRIDWREKALNADRLQGMRFNPVTFVVPGLIPSEGATLICSKPKVGKSWLVLDIAIGATANRFVLGDLRPKQGDVLYLALEDSARRLQSRMTKLLGTFAETWPPGLTFATQWARVDQGGCIDIRA